MKKIELEFHLATLQQCLSVLGYAANISKDVWSTTMVPTLAYATFLTKMLADQTDEAKGVLEELMHALTDLLPGTEDEKMAREQQSARWERVRKAHKAVQKAFAGRVAPWLVDGEKQAATKASS